MAVTKFVIITRLVGGPGEPTFPAGHREQEGT